jgi:16S rRNA A1518/A1519 N6-dimethyltransferase RsmA/KsgA/DIM1 with predicted DNA glycosylase/AP lyase activity
VPKNSVQAALQSLSLPEKLRAEQFTLEQFAELSNALYSA